MLTRKFSADESLRIIDLALTEDRVHDDATSRALIQDDLHGRAVLLAKASGVVAGMDVFRKVFTLVNRDLKVTLHLKDGNAVGPGEIAAEVSGPVRGILAGERVALNFVCHLSGIATLTARYVDEVKGFPAIITDTRKTLPGMRRLEKEAVRAGGGVNHRFSLADGVLVKDNHIAILRKEGKSLRDIVRLARANAPREVQVEIEVTNLQEAEEAASAGAGMLLLDNMSPPSVKEIVEKMGTKVILEASGGITLENVRRFAETGVHRISIGALTHSARALDLSLELS